MSGQFIAFLITGLSHVGAAAVLLVMLFRLGNDRPQDSRGWWDDQGGPGKERPDRPDRSPGGGGIPLPDAVQSTMRMRGPGRLADANPFPVRRSPAREPAPQRDTEPAG
ncbi:MAG: hypothetical protein F2813_04635 [Actinobacteria bacterium]|uniref:Unannotated protein n=1 Tax=freshwater metagenome TaxID=449393 RepID=A0A6J5ZUB7_9ZZZZ|nr:hypothetical protein [Actinomycetota bacterium]